MNQVRAIAKMNEDELAHGLSGTSGSWHAQYRGNAWVYCGGFDPRLNEGDVLAVFSQYGEVEDLHLVRDADTGKSKGFAFLKYEDERSTVLAVDNLNAAQLMGRTLRVDHTEYRPPKKKKDEERLDEANGAAYQAKTSGHAHVGKDLATGHSLEKGVNVFDVSSLAVAKKPPVVDVPLSENKRGREDMLGAGAGADNIHPPASKRAKKDKKKGEKEKKKKRRKKEKKEKKKKKKERKREKKKKKKKKKKKDAKQQGPAAGNESSSSSSSGASGSDESNDEAALAAAQAFLDAQKQ